MSKFYKSALLPFQGQKRRYVGEFRRVLGEICDARVFVDLFGGSGLLSHVVKRERPDAVVIYNDFDGCRTRLDNIPRTNALISKLRGIMGGGKSDAPASPSPLREHLLAAIAEEEASGYVDYITIAANLCFPGKRATSYDELAKNTLYNRIVASPYDASGYLDGLIIESCDYRELVARYRDRPDVVFLADPPYLSTDVSTYTMTWGLSDYLDVIAALAGQRYIYFTSSKSSIVELCDWLGHNAGVGNMFASAFRVDIATRVNHSSGYSDIMLYNAV